MKVQLVPFKSATDAVAIVSFPHNSACTYWSYRSAAEGCPYTDEHLDGGAVAAALVSTIRSRLCHPAAVAAANGLTSLNAVVTGTHVIIAANCKKSASGIRKVCNAIIKSLQPAALYGQYGIFIRRIVGKTSKGVDKPVSPDRDAFDYAAAKLSKGLEGLQICLCGNVSRLTREHTDNIAEAAEKKVTDKVVTGGKPRKDYGVDIEVCCTFSTLSFKNQLEAVVAQDYLMSICSVFDNIHDGKIDIDDASLKAIKMADKESKLDRYATKFLEARHEDGRERMIYYAASRGYLTAEEAATRVSFEEKDILRIVKVALE
jgi:hypothetical protein